MQRPLPTSALLAQGASHLAALGCILLAFAPPVSAAEKPLWEAGLGVAAIDFPDYRGSDERQSFVLPVPYVIYRGEIFQADREGASGRFFRSDRIDLALSINGSIPVDSSDNATRNGMPDLDPTLEIGPKLEVRLVHDARRAIDVSVTLPARAVIATDFSHTYNAGWVFQPRVDFDFKDTWLGEGWNVGVGLGPMFGDKRYHNYFYGVPQEFATAQRPAHVAGSGYAGWQAIGSVSRRFAGFWLGAFVRADTLEGSALEESPLVRQSESYSAGVAITWMLGHSERVVTTEED